MSETSRPSESELPTVTEYWDAQAPTFDEDVDVVVRRALDRTTPWPPKCQSWHYRSPPIGSSKFNFALVQYAPGSASQSPSIAAE